MMLQHKITNIIVDKSYLKKAIEISNFNSKDLNLIFESKNYLIKQILLDLKLVVLLGFFLIFNQDVKAWIRRQMAQSLMSKPF